MHIQSIEAGPGSVVDIPSGPLLPSKVSEGNLFLLTIPVPSVYIGLAGGWRSIISDSAMIAENPSNRFFTESRALSSPLTGLSLVTSTPVVITDTLLVSIGKLQSQYSAHAGVGGSVHANSTISTSGFMSAADKSNLDSHINSITGHPIATQSSTGFLSAADKVKIDTQIATYKYLTADVVNSQAVANTLVAIPDLSFSVVSGVTYTFKFVVPYISAAITTGSRWVLTGPTITSLTYSSRCTLSATTETVNYASAYSIPAAANSGSLTVGNMCILEGVIKPSAAGTVSLSFASEIASSAITAKVGASLNYTSH